MFSFYAWNRDIFRGNKLGIAARSSVKRGRGPEGKSSVPCHSSSASTLLLDFFQYCNLSL